MNYFDHAASTFLYPEVLDQLQSSLKEDFANPSAQHILGHDLTEKISFYREEFLKTLGAFKNDFFIFTSSATESNNTVIKGITFGERDSILYCRADHPSVTAPVESTGVLLKEILLNNDGVINVESFEALLDSSVKLVILSHVNNQNGVIQDIELLARIVKEKSGAHVHIDAVQSFGKIPFKLSPAIDSISVTSHKIGGPKGVAGLYLKNGHNVKPLLLGGGQEHGLRSSTESFPLIKAFHQAMKIAIKEFNFSSQKISGLSEVIKLQLLRSIPTIQMPFQVTSPYIVSFILPGISSDIILRHLEMRDVFISSTSACSSKQTGVNPTLSAMHISERFHKNFLRISLGPKTTEEEVKILLKEFVDVWGSVKHMQKR
ncbi:cysteine desulfurase family protein [Bacteriovorax sp. PP10]|uniref:Cysteine desulfurase family protein n=1 Tax=Bacteriovorax antarcticus TaxID=3088717 RepID=A0ABU5VUW9_9BACT|nr:cysteine desulfurase family protein [Bacteriovorax sp. PP10]MEA9356198.1 cysteine desulfurase family protein [Bacteriovorax sp. PP10]